MTLPPHPVGDIAPHPSLWGIARGLCSTARIQGNVAYGAFLHPPKIYFLEDMVLVVQRTKGGVGNQQTDLAKPTTHQRLLTSVLLVARTFLTLASSVDSIFFCQNSEHGASLVKIFETAVDTNLQQWWTTKNGRLLD